MMTDLKNDFRRILVIQTAFLGDAVLSIPLLKIIRHKYPQAKLAFVCREGFSEFFLASKLIDQVIEVDKGNSLSPKNAFKEMKRFESDLVISPHRSFRTALWIFRLRPKMSIGFSGRWSFISVKRKVPYIKSDHDVMRQVSLTSVLGVAQKDIPQDLLTLFVDIPPNERFKNFSSVTALSPGSQWNTKKWTITGYIQVARTYVAMGKTVVILGSKSEFELGEKIAAEIKGVVNFCGKTSILELAQILKQAELLICNDSGTMHVASSVGTPVVSIFGPTVTAQGYSPWNPESRVVEVPLPCRPCGAHGHDLCL